MNNIHQAASASNSKLTYDVCVVWWNEWWVESSRQHTQKAQSEHTAKGMCISTDYCPSHISLLTFPASLRVR